MRHCVIVVLTLRNIWRSKVCFYVIGDDFGFILYIPTLETILGKFIGLRAIVTYRKLGRFKCSACY
jgi:hypothetical protein